MSVTVTPDYCVPKHQASTSHSLASRGHVRPRHSPARYVTVEESDDEYYNESNHGAFVDYLSGPPRVASGSASGATAAGFNRNRDAEGGCRTPPPAKIAQMTHMDTACCHDGRHRQVRSVKVHAAVRRPGGSIDCGRITPDADDGGLPLVVSLPRPRVRVVTIRPQNTSRYGGGGHDGDDDDDDDATPTLPTAARPATSMHPSSAASHSNGDDSDASSTTSVSTAGSSRTSGSGVSDMSFKFCQG